MFRTFNVKQTSTVCSRKHPPVLLNNKEEATVGSTTGRSYWNNNNYDFEQEEHPSSTDEEKLQEGVNLAPRGAKSFSIYWHAWALQGSQYLWKR